MIMTNTRQKDGNSLEVPNRTDRLFNDESRWYFKTREGGNIGPFRYRSEAKTGLALFIHKATRKSSKHTV